MKLTSYKSKMAIGLESAYAVKATSFNVVRLVTENIIKDPVFIRSNAKFGVNGKMASYHESIKYGGTVVAELDYYDSLPLLMALCGASASDVTTTPDTPAVGYTENVIKLGEDFSQSFTVLKDTGGEGLKMYVGGKVVSGTITIASGGAVTIELEMAFKNEEAVTSETVPTLIERELMTLADVVYRVKADADQTLAPADEYEVSVITHNIAWNLLIDALVSGGLILEPIPSGAKEVTLSLENPEFDDASPELAVLRDAKGNDTPVTQDFTLTTTEVGNAEALLKVEFQRSKVVAGFEPETSDEIIPVAGETQPYRNAESDAEDKEFFITYITKDVP